jgi:hypothetical protein
MPSRVVWAIPDEEFNQIFVSLDCPPHRDSARVAFYVTIGAQAFELPPAAVGGADVGRQLIVVTRKAPGVEAAARLD